MSFSVLGYEKAEQEIQKHEQNDASAVYSEIKPFTTKAPTHVIEALDIVAEDFGLSRNALVLKILEVYLGHAFVDYQNGYGHPFGQDVHTYPVQQLEVLLKKANPSKESREYLERTVFSAMGITELLGEKK